MRVAVVGSGPAGIYTASSLAQSGEAEGGVQVDVIERLPAPFGLARYGVAPDHPKIKSICGTLEALLTLPGVRFLGNVEVGTDVSVAELLDCYDAVVLAYGAADDRRLEIPGEDLPGSIAATNFVRWYSGHPDEPTDTYRFDFTTAVVIGMGNVALDVTRMLARAVDDLRVTDVPAHVLDALAQSQVTDLHVVGRRGPAQAKWTTNELREIGEMPDVDVVVDARGLVLDKASEEILASSPIARRNLAVMQAWSERPLTGASQRIHFHFHLRPTEIVGTDRVTGARFERTEVQDDGRVSGTGVTDLVEAQAVFRSIGYHGRQVGALPFDERSGTMPNEAGRVVQGTSPLPRLYVAGWLKRGPTGVIGTNKRDANETVASLLADEPALPQHPQQDGAHERAQDGDALLTLLGERGVQVVSWEGWLAIQRAELEQGEAMGRGTAKIVDRDELLRAASTPS